MAGLPVPMSGQLKAPQSRSTTSATPTTSQVAKRGPPVPSWMWANALGPKPSRPNAYSIRPDVADVARWQPNAATVAVKMMSRLNHCPTYVLPKSPSVFPELWNASRPAASVPNPTTWANITTTNSPPVRSSVPASALGMLRPGSSVSSPIEAQASNPAHDRNAATTPLITA